MKCLKYNFFLLYIILLIPKLSILKLYEENPSDSLDYYYKDASYHEKNYFYNKHTNNKNKDEESNNYDSEDFEKPASTFEFIINYIKNRIKAYFYDIEEYIDGLKFVLSKYKYLFRRYAKNRIINKTLSTKKYNRNDDNDFIKHKRQRKLEQNTIKKPSYINKLDESLHQSYPYNNSDLYDRLNCPTIPDLKVYYYYYFCDNVRVSKEEYINRTSEGELCEFYNNTQKICFCPVHYTNCQFKRESFLKCMAKKLIVNNEIDLTKYYDTFYDEHTKIPILDNDKKIYEFSLNIKCGMELNDSISGSDVNFYLFNKNDEFPDFDVISTEYHNETENGTQYTKDEVMDNETQVFDYFIKKKNLILFKNTNLTLRFSLIDQMWAIPYRYKLFEINEYSLKKILSGEENFNFTVDINDLIKNEDGEGPFSKYERDYNYPSFDKGDIHFFEIEISDIINKQIRFVPFRGEIKK